MSSKENKKLAQQRRAEERARAAQRAKMKRIGIGVAVVAVIAALIVLPGKFGGATDEDTETAEETAGEAETDAVDETESTDTDSADEAAEPTLDTTEGREVKDGDTVNIDYTGYKDGEAFDGGSTNGAGADLEIGSGTYIDGFESGLIGKKVGDTVDLDLTFPENYGAEDLAGADVTFTVTINGIYDK